MRLQRTLQIVADNAHKPMSELRILDTGCYEGRFAIEFARRGATVIGIEGRKTNLETAEATKKALNLTRIDFFHDDVRNLSREKYGTFDVVLCLGILYHLDTPDVFHFLEKIAEVCEGFVIIDTHISQFPVVSTGYKGKTYWGRIFLEHLPESSPEERLQDTLQSLDNPRSFWLTRASLFNFLSDTGFTSAYECGFPAITEKHNRAVFLAIKGQPIQSSEQLNLHQPVPEIGGTILILYRLYRLCVRPIRVLLVRIYQMLFRRGKLDPEQAFGFWGRYP